MTACSVVAVFAVATSLDAFYLIERGQTLAAAAYMVGSVVLSVAALVGAIHLVRALS